MVKNAVIVPVGAKGGFVVKRPPRRRTARRCTPRASPATGPSSAACSTSPTTSSPARSCRRPSVVRYDADDPYLVVAADKGTATFSDIANAIAAEYGFWLGDAFASGGSAGYDHKKMGITARGAWESVKRHFRELGQRHPGGGLHRRRHRRHVGRRVRQRHAALAAHPAGRRPSTTATSSSTPIPTRSAASRSASGCSSCRARRGRTTTRRSSPRAAACYPRTAKSIPLSPQARAVLGIERRGARAQRADPGDPPARRSTCSGTAASAPTSRPRDETHADVGDKANDARARRRRASCAARSSARAATSASRSAARDRVRARRRPDQHRRDRQLGRRRLLRPRGQHQDPARRGRRRRRPDRASSATSCSPR